MANSGKRDEEVYDRTDRFDVGEFEDSLADGSGTISTSSGGGSLSENGIGLTERLTDILVERGDGDLLLQQSNHDDMLLQWLRALDMQVIGACRVDERLTPLLKLNAPGGAADDRLLAHLSQHFEPSEVGVLARCFCMPLVSIRVGKIEKQGTLLFPTSARGNLNLILLPTSDLRVSFVGDDGQTERIYTLSNSIESSLVAVEEMSEDTSGRSFLVKVPDGREFFFWSSEKSKLLGDELLRKMGDLLKKRPSIADLTGINESRLSCFAASVRTYLSGPSPSTGASVSGSPHIISSTSNSHNNARENYPSTPNVPLPQRKVTENSSSSLTVTEEADNSLDAVMMGTTSNSDLHRSSAEEAQEHKGSCKISLDFLESLSQITMPPSFRPICLNQQPILSPYYCWCPPSAPPNEPITSSLPQHPSLSLSDLPTNVDFPTTFSPDPFPNLVNSHQSIPAFTPLMCDLPIIHIPVIGVGQGYLVSTGPTVPPLHTKLMNNHHHPLIPEPNSLALEEGARETLRFLLAGSSALTSTSPSGERMEFFGAIRDATAVGIGLISLPRIPGLDGDNTGAEVNDDDDDS